jgi:hypothetical protein
MGERQNRALRRRVGERTTTKTERNIMQTKLVKTDQPPKQENSMNRTKCSKIGFVFGTALLGALTGCVGYVDGPRHARVYAPAPAVYVDAGVVVQDDYVYYPGYQVYYSSHRHQYIYRDGRSWVTRAAPPRVSAEVLFASPSVRLDFHDSPSIHHAAVVKQYPKKWKPPGQQKENRGNGRGNRGNGKDNGHGNH